MIFVIAAYLLGILILNWTEDIRHGPNPGMKEDARGWGVFWFDALGSGLVVVTIWVQCK